MPSLLLTTKQAAALLYLFAPAFAANAAPIIAAQVPGIRHRAEPVMESLFGSHKTWRGIVSGMICAVLTGFVQYLLHWTWPFAQITSYQRSMPVALIVACLLGAGALAGDLIKSMAKRILKRPPGSSWVPWDAVDYMIGAIIFLWPIYLPHPSGVVLLLIIGPLLSRVANGISYLIGWKKVWY